MKKLASVLLVLLSITLVSSSQESEIVNLSINSKYSDFSIKAQCFRKLLLENHHRA